MFYLVLAIASSAMVSVCMRLSEKHITNQMGMFLSNYGICCLLSAGFMNWKNINVAVLTDMAVVTLGIISGVLYLAGFVFLKYNMRHNGIVLSSTFMKLGVLIPIVMAILLFHEVPRGTRILGILLSLVGIVMIHFEKDAVKEGNKKIWLLLLMLVCGITDSMANIYEQVGRPEGKDAYLLLTFFTAFVCASVLAFVGKDRVSKKDLLFGLLIGVPNYFSARFLLLALGSVEAVLVYPMYSVGTIILISVIGVLFFHEEISKKKAGALAFILVAVCLMNL